MRNFVVLCLAASACLSAQVRFTSDKMIEIEVDGKPFTTFHYGGDSNKPYLSPLRSADDKTVTRLFPMEYIEGESRDHFHHRGLWVGYKDVNGYNFWENEPSYVQERGPSGHVIVKNAVQKPGDKSGSLIVTMDWVAPTGKTLLTEDRTMTFYGDPKLRVIDITDTFTAITDVTFGDSHDGLLGIRLAEPFTERKGGIMTDAQGRQKMMKVWGHQADWVDYTGVVDGERLGVAIFDNAKNPNYPTYWHARDYGLFAADPLARNAFDPKLPEQDMKLTPGQKMTFRWRVVIHPGDTTTGNVAEMYKQYQGEE